MFSDRSNDRRTPKPSERGKLLLIPALGGVLLYVVFGMDGSAEAPPEVEAAAVTEPSARSVDAPTPPRAAVPAWPDHPLEDILAHDPFAPHDAQPALSAQSPPAPARPATAADVARGLTVSAIFRGPQGMTAVVDGQPVRVGDELAGGLRVTRIDASGIEVAPQAQAPVDDGSN